MNTNTSGTNGTSNPSKAAPPQDINETKRERAFCYLSAEAEGNAAERAQLADLDHVRSLGRKAGRKAARATFKAEIDAARASFLASERNG